MSIRRWRSFHSRGDNFLHFATLTGLVAMLETHRIATGHWPLAGLLATFTGVAMVARDRVRTSSFDWLALFETGLGPTRIRTQAAIGASSITLGGGLAGEVLSNATHPHATITFRSGALILALCTTAALTARRQAGRSLELRPP